MGKIILGVNSKLELKTLQQEDAEILFELVDKNRSYLRTWLPWLDKTQSVSDIKNFIAKGLERLQKDEGFELGIWFEGNLVGVIGVTIIKDDRLAKLGYWLGEIFQGKGIMTKTVSAVTAYIFQKLKVHRVTIKAAVKNKKSRAIPERLGFEPEGIEREAGWLYDHFVDLQVYSLLERDE